MSNACTILTHDLHKEGKLEKKRDENKFECGNLSESSDELMHKGLNGAQSSRQVQALQEFDLLKMLDDRVYDVIFILEETRVSGLPSEQQRFKVGKASIQSEVVKWNPISKLPLCFQNECTFILHHMRSQHAQKQHMKSMLERPSARAVAQESCAVVLDN